MPVSEAWTRQSAAIVIEPAVSLTMDAKERKKFAIKCAFLVRLFLDRSYYEGTHLALYTYLVRL